MLKELICLMGLILSAGWFCPQAGAHAIYFDDAFTGSSVNEDLWHIPTWEGPDDGTYLGRTQMRCTQNSGLPLIANESVQITVESYNPTGFSFYGTDLITNQTFEMRAGMGVSVRAKVNEPVKPGTVCGIFWYALNEGGDTLHDEIDFELLGNRPGQVHTNIYANEELGEGHWQFSDYESGSVTDYHTYEIVWFPNRVLWLVDDKVIRVETEHVPTGPMAFHLNMWVPDSEWAAAYDPTWQPVSSAEDNETASMSVDWIDIVDRSTDAQPSQWVLFQ